MAFSKTSRVLTQAATKKVAKKGGGLFGTKKVAAKKGKAPKRGASVDRPTWFPGAVPPAWLDGTLPGDVGCDPFGLAKPVEYLQFDLDKLNQNDAVNKTGEVKGFFKAPKEKNVGNAKAVQPYDEVFGLDRFRECEVIHGRWAMLAVLGIVAAESATGLSWLEVGKAEIDGVNYAGLNLPFTISQLTVIEVLLMGYIEVARNSSTDPEQRCYPGGSFDPFNLAADPEKAFSLKTAEIKHSRLAMVAFLGCSIQGLKNGRGALEALNSIGQ
jgi:light-harvesting complex II chlorophyll a/b binding protein 4|uniref:Chlorophyll a-b binding protein, chloroplastic n=1 Tax=Prasinoderma singulare TaxID=676789 RepID=A0A7S3BLU5_9VIRI